jgi:hypothetical protein
MLMPSFAVAVTNILSSRAQLQGLHGTMTMLRRSSLNMMMQLICWPKLYGRLPLNTRDVLVSGAVHGVAVLPVVMFFCCELTPHLHDSAVMWSCLLSSCTTISRRICAMR